jgi:D-alanyl-D-alanine carboxypeptidase
VWLVGLTTAVVACGGGDLATNTAATTVESTTTATSTSVVTSTASADRQAALDQQRETYGSPGALAVVRLNGESWVGFSGAADTDGTEITDRTTFRIGSVTKPIVAALVLDAAARGELSLDDIVSEILPGDLRSEPPISVRMLLDHTSGVFDEGNEGDIEADIEALTDPELRASAVDLADRYYSGENVIAPDRLLVALAETHERYFAPGSGCHYSNINYQLAGMVLERATGVSVADLLQSRIAAPLELERTTIAPPDIASPDMRGYEISETDGSLVDLTDDLISFGNGGNGGIISTGDELLTVMQAIVAGRFLPAASVADMKTATEQSGLTYGLGLATYDLSCGTYFGHGGSVNGTVSIALVTPDGSGGVVIAFNLRDARDPELLQLADDLLCGQ